MSWPPSLPDTWGWQAKRAAGDGRSSTVGNGDPVIGAVLEDLDQPPGHVAAPVAAGRSGTHRHGDVHLAAGLVQLLRDLHARLAGAHDQHGPVGELVGPAVVVRVQLLDGPARPWDAAGTLGCG